MRLQRKSRPLAYRCRPVRNVNLQRARLGTRRFHWQKCTRCAPRDQSVDCADFIPPGAPAVDTRNTRFVKGTCCQRKAANPFSLAQRSFKKPGAHRFIGHLCGEVVVSRMMAAGNPVVPEFDDGETASADRVVGMGDGLQCSPRSQKQQRMEDVPFWRCSARRVYSTNASYCSCFGSAGP